MGGSYSAGRRVILGSDVRKLLKSKVALASIAILTGSLAGALYKVFGALTVALLGSLVAVVNAFFDKKLTRPRFFLAVCAVALAFGGALMSYFDARKAQAESHQFQTAVQTATTNLLSKTDEVARMATQVFALSKENAALSKTIVEKSDFVADLSRSVAFPLHNSIVANIAIEIPGDQGAVAAYAARLHATAFPEGKQKLGYIDLQQLDSRIPEQSALARFVGDLRLYFVFCATETCQFDNQVFRPGQKHGVEMCASAIARA